MIMNIHNSEQLDIYDSIMDIRNCIMDIHNSIRDIHIHVIASWVT